ncbi:MAG: long-chain fatty acid--CoA ligase [Myxococcales bacterium]|nr:long-chain fatty acid--CoA ligase [Myxococcales bacterium]
MIDSIPHRVLRFAERQPEHPALHFRPGENWQTTTWRQYGDAVLDFAGALLALGYAPGQGVGILGNNRPEWIIADLGAMAARAVPAGIYQTLTAEQAAYIADHCEAKVVVVEDARQWEKLRQELDAGRLPKVEKVVLMTGAVDDPRTVPFFEFLSTGRDHRAAVEARLAELQDDDLATLIYTSGTTGPPKGVMLTHRNLAWTAQQANEAVGGFLSPADSVVSYLPLSHIAEQMFSIHLPATYGFPLWMTDRMESLKDTLLAGRPTLFLAVPRVWEKFKAALEGKLAEAKGPKAAIVRWARGVGAKAAPALVERGELSGLLAIQYRAANRLFFSKLAAGLGLDRLQCAVTGAAPIGRDVLDFFASCGVLIHEVYGQSEDAGPTTFNQVRPGQRRLGSAGKPLPGVDVRIAADGEICVRGPNVFAGYYKEPAATAETLIDGWLHSGDVGRFDEDGFLYITDRKKDLIITAGGKNVAPQNIEKRLKAIPGVGQAVVIGDRRKYLSALLTLDPEAAPRIAAEHGLPTDLHALAVHPGLHQLLQAGVDRANDGLARYEQVKRFAVLPIDFTVEGGELTPTQKVKRKVVNEKYAEQIAHLYDEPGS